jgi:hypothetical protein
MRRRGEIRGKVDAALGRCEVEVTVSILWSAFSFRPSLATITESDYTATVF